MFTQDHALKIPNATAAIIFADWSHIGADESTLAFGSVTISSLILKKIVPQYTYTYPSHDIFIFTRMIVKLMATNWNRVATHAKRSPYFFFICVYFEERKGSRRAGMASESTKLQHLKRLLAKTSTQVASEAKTPTVQNTESFRDDSWAPDNDRSSVVSVQHFVTLVTFRSMASPQRRF